MTIKDEIKKLEEIANTNIELDYFLSDFGKGVKQGANDALIIINKLLKVFELQQKALKEIDRDHYDHVMAPVIAMNTLAEVKQLLEE